jgi:dTDP-4-amino-4,6-dideoxygalactose transaminase
MKKKHGLYIIEDAACSIGAGFKGEKVGKMADISVFSLHPRKFITTGEGGMITTDNDAWAKWMNSFKHFGMNSGVNREDIGFEMIGTNYKLSNILSAIGLEQMKIVSLLLSKRRELAENYYTLLGNNQNFRFQEIIEGGCHSYQSFCILVKNRNNLMDYLRSIGIEVQIGTYSLHMHRAFHDNPHVRISGTMENSKSIFNQSLTLPLFHQLTSNEQEWIANELINYK